MDRRALLPRCGAGWGTLAAIRCSGATATGAELVDASDGDAFKSFQWAELGQESPGSEARVQFDSRARVQGPAFAEAAMSVPITVTADLPGVRRIIVLVARTPIRLVLELQPLAARAAVSLRFKLEQASPVRALALALAADGIWYVGGTWVDSAAGGCTVAGATRSDGSWSQTLGQVSGRLYASVPGGDSAARLRLRVMHSMDNGPGWRHTGVLRHAGVGARCRRA